MDRQLANMYPSAVPPEGLPRLKEMVVGSDERNRLAGLLDLVGAVPDELRRFPPTGQAHFIIAVATIRGTIQEWDRPKLDARLGPISLDGQENPVHALYRLFKSCADEAPDTDTPGLTFIADAPLRESFRLDISSAHKSLSHGEWKSATVLAGSVIEALLLWAVKTNTCRSEGLF